MCLSSCVADALHVAVHAVVDDVDIQAALEPAQVEAMLRVKVGRGIKRPEVEVDAVLLDKGVLADPIHRRALQIGGCCTIATERAVVAHKAPLQGLQIPAVQNEAFQANPLPGRPDFDPAVDDAARREAKAEESYMVGSETFRKNSSMHGREKSGHPNIRTSQIDEYCESDF